jgi:FlaA1/EpsC-like NDP-sugar epimerase
MFDGKRVVVTGGTGSLGKTLVKRILSGDFGLPEKLIVFSRDEAKQHYMRLDFMNIKVAADDVLFNNFKRLLEFRIGDVRNYTDVVNLVKGADIIVHAAAMKQVPACEYFPIQAVMTNCIGSQNIIDAINNSMNTVKTVVGISTDKACKPVNVMGMTKALQERIFTTANIMNPEIRFIGVRYGNVLASRGSVIPMFHDQILGGNKLTVTVPDMTRFLLTLNQATDTVFAALKDAKPGDIFVPNAPSASIINIAKAIAEENGGHITITGIRPGEKMHEIMVSEEECNHTIKRNDYYAIRPMLPELSDEVQSHVSILTKEFSSVDNVLDFSDTKKLLAKNNLLVVKNSITM